MYAIKTRNLRIEKELIIPRINLVVGNREESPSQ